jgi:hypothetical protein
MEKLPSPEHQSPLSLCVQLTLLLQSLQRNSSLHLVEIQLPPQQPQSAPLEVFTTSAVTVISSSSKTPIVQLPSHTTHLVKHATFVLTANAMIRPQS